MALLRQFLLGLDMQCAASGLRAKRAVTWRWPDDGL